MFGKFYDENKTKEANAEEFAKAHHNKEVTQHYVIAVALFTGICAAIVAGKKVYNEVV